MLLLKKLLGEVPMTYNGGGKSAPAQAVAPLIAPTSPIEEASVEIDDDDGRNELKTSKSSLKIPIAKTVDTGLNV